MLNCSGISTKGLWPSSGRTSNRATGIPSARAWPSCGAAGRSMRRLAEHQYLRPRCHPDRHNVSVGEGADEVAAGPTLRGHIAPRQPPALLPLLSRGKHRSPLKGACFMEFASMLAGERWSDHPACTHPLLAAVAPSRQ
jgi:hypothetical protein